MGNWLSTGYIQGRLNTSDGLTKSIPNTVSGGLLIGDIPKIVTAPRKGEIVGRLPAPKRYIMCIMKQFMGQKDLDIWQATEDARGGKFALGNCDGRRAFR